jgi:hypothetical protein
MRYRPKVEKPKRIDSIHGKIQDVHEVQKRICGIQKSMEKKSEENKQGIET